MFHQRYPMFQLTFCHPPNSPFTLNFDSLLLTGHDLKLRLLPFLEGGVDPESMRLVCGGKVIQDQGSLELQGVVDNCKIYISIRKLAAVQAGAAIPQAKKPESDPLMAPLLKFLSANPELYQQMIMSNPQMKKLLEKNPELGHALSDPSTLKSMLQAASNPTAYNEMLRGHDRAMSNLENIPEGFSHLKKIYSNLQEPMYDALTPTTRIKAIESDSSCSSGDKSAVRMTTREPMPNPWAPSSPPAPKQLPKTSGNPVFGFKAHPHKRKHSHSYEDDEDEAEHEEVFGNLSGSMDAMRLLSPLAAPSPSASTDRFHAELEVLHQLGFEDDEGENIPALLATGGHVSAAIDRILQRRGV